MDISYKKSPSKFDDIANMYDKQYGGMGKTLILWEYWGNRVIL